MLMKECLSGKGLASPATTALFQSAGPPHTSPTVYMYDHRAYTRAALTLTLPRPGPQTPPPRQWIWDSEDVMVEG